jgi:glycosyltransferase involved in cell wall biosynthesis
MVKIREADLVCIPSRWESSSYVALEAGAVGRPVIATNVDGLNDIILPGVTGQLVSPNDPIGLAAALDEAAESPNVLQRWGLEGYRRVRELFTLDRMVDQTMDVYRSVPGIPAPSRGATR